MSSDVPTADQQRLQGLYVAFNARDIDAVLASLAPDVRWPRAWEGDVVVGHDAVRDYWTRQWTEIDPTVVPTAFAKEDDGRVDVTVAQTVRNLDGDVVAEATVHHVYRFRDGAVADMEIRA